MPWERDSSQYQTCSSMEQIRQWIYWFDLYEKNTLPLHFSGYLMNITKNYCVPSFPKYQGLRAAKNHVSTRSTKSQKTHPMSFLRTNMEMRLCLGYGLSQKTQKSKRRFCSTRPKSENIISKWQTNTIVWFFARRSFRNIFCRFLRFRCILGYFGYFQTLLAHLFDCGVRRLPRPLSWILLHVSLGPGIGPTSSLDSKHKTIEINNIISSHLQPVPDISIA